MVFQVLNDPSLKDYVQATNGLSVLQSGAIYVRLTLRKKL